MEQKKEKFNQAKYIQEYQNEHYAIYKAKLKPEEYQKIENYRTKYNLNKSDFLRKIIKEFIEIEKKD